MMQIGARAGEAAARRPGRGAGAAYVAVLAAGYVAVLMANLPGHLTFDSLLELYEGRYRVRQSWAPSFYAWVLGVFDRIWSGTGLYVIASGLLLLVALASFVGLRRGRASRWAVVLTALFCASPMLLIYQGIVWKDVLFANAAVAGMTALAWAVRGPQSTGRRGAALTIALVLLAAAALLRQNGVIVAVAAAAAMGWIMAERRWRRGLAWGLGSLAAVVAVSHAMDLATRPQQAPAAGQERRLGPGDGMAEGLRILRAYDIQGVVAADPKVALPAVTASDPAAAKVIRQLAPRYYSAQRTGITDGQPQLHQAVLSISDAALASDWRDIILRRPGLYLRQRLAVFGWVFLTPNIDRCLPVALGIQGPDEVMDELGIDGRWSAVDERLLRYDRAFLRTPAHSHPVYALLALAVGLLLLRRREPADIVMAALMAAALAFAASFFLISIACDFRYLYFLDLAAMAGAIYVALDPPWRSPRGRRASGAVGHATDRRRND